MRRNVEIRKMLITAILALSIIPIVVLSLLSMINNGQTTNMNYQENGKMLLNISQQIIDDKVNGYINDLKVVTNDGDFSDINHLKEYMTVLEDKDDCLLSFYYGEEETGYFIQSLEQAPKEGYNPKTRPWYIDSVENKGETVIQNPYEDATTGKTVITISQAVIRDK